MTGRIADLAWPGARLLGEADGASVHNRPEAVFRDRWRQNELANAGWTIVRFTWEDTLRPGCVVYVVRNALARAGT
jgi:very-short-patch-repair endonuclease